MKANILVALSIIILVASSLASSAVYAQPPTVTVTRVYWGSATNLVQAAPGDINTPLNIVIQNYGPTEWEPITSLNAQLDLHNLPFTDSATGSSYSTAGYPDTLKSGQSATLTFYLNIAPDADIKTYDVPLTLEVITPKYQTAVEVPLTVKVPLLGKATFSLDVDPASLQSGNSQLSLILTNSGTGSATSVQVSISVPTPLALTGQSNILIEGSIPSETNFTFPVSLYIPSSSAGSAYTITAAVTYSDPYGTTRSETHQVGFSVEREQRHFDIKITPSILNTGNNEVMLSLQNNGPPAFNVEITYNVPTPLALTGQSNTRTVYSIPSETNFTFPVSLYIPSSSAGAAYQITAAITYNEPYGTTRSETYIVGFSVGTEQTQFDVRIEPSVLNVGNNIVKLSIGNTGPSTSNVELNFNPPNILTIAGVNRWVFPSFANGETVTVDIPVYVPESSAGGIGQGSLSISYTNPSGIIKTESTSFSIAVLQPSKPNIVLTPHGTSLTSGSENTIILDLTNEGDSDVYSLDVTVTMPSSTGTYPLMLLGSGNVWHFDQVKPKSSVKVNMTLATASGISGTYPLTVALNYKNQAGNTFTETRTLGLLVSLAANEWQSPLAIYANTNSLTAGYTNRPTITIRNSGESPLTSVNVLISAKESTTTTTTSTTTSNALVITSGTERWLFESIKPDVNVTITPEIFASLDCVDSNQIITLSISYLDNLGNLHTESRTIGFTVKGAIIISVQGEQVTPASISAGEEFTITGNLLNKGNTDALYGEISLKPDPNFVSSSGSQYIGDITVNTLIPFSLSCSAQRNVKEGTHPITAVLTYEDSYGETYSKEITVQVSISKSTAPPAQTLEDTGSTLTLFGIIFIAALLAIAGGGSIAIFKVYRGRKRTLEA